jgi:hypothetical protein
MQVYDCNLKKLGLEIYNKSMCGENVDGLLAEFIKLSKNPKNNLNDMDLNRYGLEEVIINDVIINNGVRRNVPFLNYVFNQNNLINTLEENDECITSFVYYLRSVFHIHGGLRTLTFNYYKHGALCVILDFTEYKCNEIYEQIK